MPAMKDSTLRSDLSHAICAIQSEWSPRERSRRQRLAELRQQRLARMLSPRKRVDAYDCRCDLANEFPAEERPDQPDRQSHCFVLVED